MNLVLILVYLFFISRGTEPIKLNIGRMRIVGLRPVNMTRRARKK